MGDQWKELSGEKNWEGLLEPLAVDLQNRIKLYGVGIQAMFDSMKDDKRHLTHEKKDLFSNFMEKNEFGKLYNVTDYIYAMSDVVPWIDWIVNDQSAWIGYVAVATDKGKEVLGRRDILICWRGTISTAEWIKDIELALTSASNILGENHNNPRVHKGFLSLYKSPNIEPSCNNLSARDQVLNAVKRLVNKSNYRNEEISITIVGYSLGAALATLNAADIVANKHNRRISSDKICMVTAFVFASPKVGDKGFRNAFNTLSNLHLLNIRHKLDHLTRVPPYPYKKVGIMLTIGSYMAGFRKLFEEGIPKLKKVHQFKNLPDHVFLNWLLLHDLKEYLNELQERRKKSLFSR